MIFSGYHLGLHLLNSTLDGITLDREAIIKGKKVCRVVENSLNNPIGSRNSTFSVEGEFRKKNPGTTTRNQIRGVDETYESYPAKFFAKQPTCPEPNFISTLLNEKYIYEIFRDAQLVALDLMRGFDQFQNLLFLKYIEGQNLKLGWIPEYGELNDYVISLCDLFTHVHSIAATDFGNVNNATKTIYPDKFGYRKPILFAFTRRDIEEMLLSTLPKAQVTVLKILKEGNYTILDSIKKIEWKATNLIHFDFKLEHAFFNEDQTVKTIVDWEMADMGDVHWDLACIWYEILSLYLYDGADLDSVLTNSVESFNVFLQNYQVGYDTAKLQQYLGVVLLHKHYYGFLTCIGIKDEYAAKWLQKAKELIEETATYILVSSNPAPKSVLLKLPDANSIVVESGIIGTAQQFDELSKAIREKYNGQPPSSEALQQFIYGWFHSHHDVCDNIKTSLKDNKLKIAEPVLKGKETFIEDSWWEVERISKNNNQIIRKYSERRVAEPGVFLSVRGKSKNSDGSVLKKKYIKTFYPNFIVRPNDANPESEDLWVLSKTQIRQDDANWVRFYFHLNEKPEGINLFLNKMTALLNERCIPFQLKMRNAMSSYYRSDVAILFIHRLHFVPSLDVVLYVHSLLKDKFMRESTPKFTKTIKLQIPQITNDRNTKSDTKPEYKKLEGLAFAENPVSSAESFGNWRARLIAEIALSNWKAENLGSTLKKEMSTIGFNIYEMYRNPFPSDSEAKYNTFNHHLGRIPTLDYSYEGSEMFSPSLRFLNAARKIAFIICREAAWYGTSCNWFSYQKKGDETYFETLNEAELRGIALFLSGMSILSPNDFIFRDCADGCGCFVRSSDTNQELYDKIYNKLESQKLNRTKKTIQFEINIGKVDITSLNGQDSVRIGDSIIEQYLDTNMPLPNAYGDTSIFNAEFNPTITHGLAAIGYFFLMLADFGNDRIKPLNQLLSP